MTKSKLSLLLMLLAASTFAGGLACDDAEEPAAPSASSSNEALPRDLLLAAAPDGALGVTEMRGSAKDGEKVVIRGVVGGRAEPIAENRAILTLLDESVKTCDQNPSDACETPWDACCEPQETISANSATVQVVDAEGQPIKAGLRGLGDLAPLSRVVIVGTFRPSADGQAAVIDASGIYIVN